MKRNANLIPLSHDHHVALEHALRLRRATADSVEAVVARFVAFFAAEGEPHFAREEAVLLPVLPAGAEHARERLLADHTEIRRRAAELREHPDAAAAAELGQLLSAHVRFEERELFPLLEARLPSAVLADVGRRLVDAA